MLKGAQAMGCWYWCVAFTHKCFGFNWGQSCLASALKLYKNAKKFFILFYNFQGNKKFLFFLLALLCNFRLKKQILTFFEQLLSNFLSNH